MLERHTHQNWGQRPLGKDAVKEYEMYDPRYFYDYVFPPFRLVKLDRDYFLGTLSQALMLKAFSLMMPTIGTYVMDMQVFANIKHA